MSLINYFTKVPNYGIINTLITNKTNRYNNGFSDANRSTMAGFRALFPKADQAWQGEASYSLARSNELNSLRFNNTL